MFFLFITLILVTSLPPVVQEEEAGTFKKGTWTSPEDDMLLKYIEKHGPENWKGVSKYSGLNRCEKSCRLRWQNHLRPNLKRGAITPDEEEKIVRLHEQFGNKWACIAKHLVGRTDNDIKNFWNLRIRRQKCVRPSSNPPQPDDDVNQPVPTSTTTNDNTETSWPVTQPQPPMYYYNPGPSSETASRGYPLMVRPLQVDRSACGLYTSVHSSSTPTHQYRPLLAYGISEPHVQGNQLPYTEVMPYYRDLPYHEPGSEYQFEGDMMSTVTDPTASLTQNCQWWAPQNTDSVIDRRHQQQQQRQEQRLSYMVPDTTPNNYTMMSWPVTGLQPPTDYYNDGLSSVTASRGYPSMPKPFEVYRSARRLNTSVPSSNASPYVISERQVQGYQIPCTEGDMMSTPLIQDPQRLAQQNTGHGIHRQQQHTSKPKPTGFCADKDG